ncbi:hypothetical protein [Methylorubrum extorquens]|uniref:Uncharacterized protein n=1 Tax=Methylorubrum extorquens (strain ATCC 14718 / DSM 1338 / JCM 2805 / NCIMB 9133 / AM1) TaxID=272630 RepID=C5ARR7_METEA|nr:hypothetical protein [Methylorubrum extorquens]ACS42405.1 Hypothetical protein MexAM1_META1p4789 [Methylorubrum extorquens AM1]MCP1544527.1 hypothetical protein [Methylorubrum extorquens]MCP1588126.1 hypothetical protein [Methylorubrum extorquens]
MLTNSMIGMIRRRWQSARPFQGHTNESLLRKIQNDAIRENVKEQARRELQLRVNER